MNSTPKRLGSPKCATGVRYTVVAALCMAAAIAYLSRNILGPAEKSIEQDLGISKEAMGFIMGSFFYSYSLMQIPGGWLSDRFGTRLVLPVLATIWALATATLGLAFDFYSLLLGYLLIGLAQGGLFPGTVITFSKWLPPSERGLAGGTLTSFMSLGGVFAALLVGRLLEPVGWRGICYVFSIPGILWACSYFVWFRNLPREHRAVNEQELTLIGAPDPTEERPASLPAGEDSRQPSRQPTSAAVWASLLATPSMWLIWGQQFFRAGGYIFFPTWFPRYLQETRGVTESQSADLMAIVLTSVVVGATAGGVIGDWTWRRTHSRRFSRQGVAIVSTSICAFSVYAAYLSDSMVAAMILMSLAAFMQAVASPCAIATAIDVGGPHVAKVYSSMNMVGNMGAAICPWVVARFVTLSGERWDLVLLLFVGIYGASVVCWALLNPVRNLVPEAGP